MEEQNGFTPAEFLRPFGEVGNLNGYLVRTCDKNVPYKLNRFRVNFIDSHLMVVDKDTKQMMHKVIVANKPKVRSEMANIASFSNKNSKKAVSLSSSRCLFSASSYFDLANKRVCRR